MVKEEIISRACGQLTKEEEILFTRGIFEHPESFWPQPCDSGGAEIRSHRKDRDFDDGVIGGRIFVDGSMFGHPIPELSRAGWGGASGFG